MQAFVNIVYIVFQHAIRFLHIFQIHLNFHLQFDTHIGP